MSPQAGGIVLLLAAVAAAGWWARRARVLRADNERLAQELAAARLQAEAAREAKSRFLTHMSHEIRTPMNAVLGMATLLGRTPLDARQRSHLSHVEAAARVLLGLLDDVLDLSRSEAGQLVVESTPFDVGALLRGAFDLLAEEAAQKDLRLVLRVDEKLPSRLLGDPLRLQQVLMSLLGNAIKFTERGEVAAEVDVVTAEPDAVVLRFAVRDTGIGVAPDRLHTLFEPFVQADRGATRRYGGTGLGLAIAQRLVQAMGGGILAASEPGRGSTFSFTVRLPRAAEGAEASADLRFAPGQRVLLVEDNEVNRIVAEQLLRAAGLAVTAAPDGRAALQRLAEDRYDAVLMDVEMPELDGLEATRRLRRMAGLEALPVIALTAHARREDRERFLAAGMDDHLTKPVDPGLLLASLGRRLRHERIATTAPAPGPQGPRGSFDREGALRRVAGNERLLRSLLADVVARFAEAPAQLRAHFDAGQLDRARELAHAVKGSAATVGAQRVARVAAHIEASARSGRGADGALVELADALVELDGEVQSWSAAPADRAERLDGAALRGALQDLDRHLATHSFSALDVMERVRGSLEGRGLGNEPRRLQEQVEQLEFGPARATLAAVAARLGLAPPGS